MTKVRHRSAPLITALEPRMLLDGAALTEATLAISETEAQTEPVQDSPESTNTELLATTDTQEPVFALSEDPAHQVIVIDESVSYAEELAADIAPGWTVIRLTSDQDGLTQLLDQLAGQSGITAIHLFSHGSDGQVQLGSFTLTASNMDSRAAELRQLGSQLTDTGDLMLYGCDVAMDFVGQSFVSHLAALTQADVAASDDATGNVVAGGDWELEYNVGQVDTATLSDPNADSTLTGTITMTTGLASGSGSLNIGQYAARLYYQASGPGGYDVTGTDAEWVDNYTTQQHVNYWGTATGSYSYPVPRWGWLPWTMHTVYYTYPVVADWNYGSGTRYGVETITIANDSDYQINVTANTLYKDNHGQIQTNAGLTSINTALYNGTFDPTDPLKNLVTASQGWWYPGGGQLQLGELAAGTYQVVVSFDTNRWLTSADNNVWWSSGNNYAQQLWGNFTINVANLNRAPVWTLRDLSQTLDGSGTTSFSIPWTLNGNQTLVDADGDALTVTATLADGSALPSWLTFNPNNLSFTGNAPANTGALTVRLTASDGQLTSPRDFTITYTHDNDQPVLVVAIPDQTWNGQGSFSYQIPFGTFTDADPGADSYTYSATRANGDPLPNWLSINTATGQISGNPPANFATLDITVTADDGSGQPNATQSNTFTLNLSNNNDIGTVASFEKIFDEDTTKAFSAADFEWTDADTQATDDTLAGVGKTLQSIRIVALPTQGTLWLDLDGSGTFDAGDAGEAVLANQVIAYASLNKLRYTPNANWASEGDANITANQDDTFTWVGSDGVDESSNVATTTLKVTLQNDAPTITFTAGNALTVRPNTNDPLATPVLVDSGLQVADADAPYTSNSANYDTIKSASISVTDSTSNAFQAGDVLSLTGTGTALASSYGLSASYDSALGVLTLTGNATAAKYQAVLRELQFSSTNTTNDHVRNIDITLRTVDVGSRTVTTFNGTSNHIDTQFAAIPMASDFTVSVWAQLDPSALSAGGQYTILGQGHSADNFFIQLAKSGSTWNLRLGDNWTINNFAVDGAWHQYTVTRSGTAGTLYVDGVKVATGTLEASLPGTDLQLGALYQKNDTEQWNGQYWKGNLADVRVYDRILNQSEINTSLDSSQTLSGYEANLMAWYLLAGDFANHAAQTSWDLSRDFNPLNGDGVDGPWALGVIDGNGSATFDYGTFMALTGDASKVDVTDSQVQFYNPTRPYYDTVDGWSRFAFSTTVDNNTLSYIGDVGEVIALPGYSNPAAVQFTAQTAGVYSVDARFWDANGASSSSVVMYEVYKVSTTGVATLVSTDGERITDDNTGATKERASLHQIVLGAGEKLVFAMHKGDAGSVSYDEVGFSLHVDLLATAVTSAGSTYYYNLATGQYLGLSATTGTWDAAKTAAEALTFNGASGYLATPTDTTSLQIVRALMQNDGLSGVWAGGYQLASADETTATGYDELWYWGSGPRAGQPFDGIWMASEPNSATEDYLGFYATSGNYNGGGYNDFAGTSVFNSLVAFGDAPLDRPAELTTLGTIGGNAMVFLDNTTVYSAYTGHYYSLDGSTASFNTALSTAAATTATLGGASQTGYLTQLQDASELAVISRLAQLNNSSGVWVALKSSYATGDNTLNWQWVSTTGAVSAYNPDYLQTASVEATLEQAGWTRVAYDDFSHGNTGWVYDGTATAVRIENGELGRIDGSWIAKNFDLNNTASTITFKLNRYDSWDGTENVNIRLRWGTGDAYVDIVTPTYLVSRSETGVVTGTATLNGKSVTYTITPVDNYGQWGFGSNAGWNDQSFKFQIDLPANFADQLTLYYKMGGTNIQGYADESFTVDNLTLWQQNVPTNTGLGGTLETFDSGVTTGWDNASNNTSNFTNTIDITNPDYGNALWFYNWAPQKTYYIDNQASRIEFDFYALDSWDGEHFYTYLNDSTVIDFSRSFGTNYTDTVTGSANVGGRTVTYTLTPNDDRGNWAMSNGSNDASYLEQSFHIVIDLPQDFGPSVELRFGNSLNEGNNNETAAIGNVKVYRLETAGWVNPNGVLDSDGAVQSSTNTFTFDGSNDYIDLGDVTGLSGAYTLEGRIFADSAAKYSRIFDLGELGINNDNIVLGFDDVTGRIFLENWNGSTRTRITTTSLLPLNEWVTVSAVNNGDGTGAIYFNGVKQTTTISGDSATLGVAANVTRADSFAGKSNWVADSYFNGQMSELRIWNDARSEAEIQANYNQSLSTPTSQDNLLGYWVAAGHDSTTIADLSGHNGSAVLVNMVEQDPNLVRLDRFQDIALSQVDGRLFTDNDWDIQGIATDGVRMYLYYSNAGTSYIVTYDMQGHRLSNSEMPGSDVGTVSFPASVSGVFQQDLVYNDGALYVRNGKSTTAASDDTVWRFSLATHVWSQVTVDADHGLLDAQGWDVGSLFSVGDGRLGILGPAPASGTARTVRLYNVAADGLTLTWSKDITLNDNWSWYDDNHGVTSDGRYLYLLKGSSTTTTYKVYDMQTGNVAYSHVGVGTLYRQGIDNATFLTRDPLTGDIYFADYSGSSIARAESPLSMQRDYVVEFGTASERLAAPLVTMLTSALPDKYVSASRQVTVRVGNTAPSVNDWSASTNEDTPLAFSAAQFSSHFSDPELDTLSTVKITALPSSSAGVLKLDGVAVTADQLISLNDLAKLRFDPAANFNGSATFSYTASDGYLDSAVNGAGLAQATVTLTVAAVNDAPVLNTAGTPTLTTIAEDVLDASNTGTTVADLVADGSLADADVGTAPEAIAVTKVDNTYGLWQFSLDGGTNWLAFSATTGKVVDLGAAARLLDASARIRFVPNADVNSGANGSPSITFRVWDQTSGTHGGTTDPNALGGNSAVSSASDTASLSITAVNDAPTTASKTVTLDEDTSHTFSDSDFAFSDIDTGDSLQWVTITALPGAGSLTLNHVAVTQGQAIAIADINAGLLEFTPVADAYGDNYAQMGFAVGDGTVFSTAATLTFNVTDTNDVPTAIAWSTGGAVAENSLEGVVVGKLTATDPNTGDSATFLRISNPNFSIAPDGTVTVAVNAVLDYERGTTQTVRVRVTDSGGLTHVQDITVTLSDVVEDAPSLIVNSLYVTKGATITITESQLKATDSVQTASQLIYTVKEAPSGGTWWIDANDNGQLDDGEALAPVNDANPNGRDKFTHADLLPVTGAGGREGRLKFTQDGTQSNSVLQVSLSDGTAASLDADGNPLVNGTLAAIVSSPPVVSAAINDQQWSTSGSQSFVLPASTFSDPDFDVLTLSATLEGGGDLPGWLTFDAATGTFSGNPADGSMANGTSLSITVKATDGRTTPAIDTFVLSFTTTPTLPQVAHPLPNVTLDGAGLKTYTVPANTFSDPNGDTFTYSATIPPEISGWLAFDAGTQTFTGNPPASAEPGPYIITVTGTANGDSVSSAFKLYVANANDLPTSTGMAAWDTASSNTAIATSGSPVQLDWTIAGTTEYTFTLDTLGDFFTDGDTSDTLTLRAGDADGNELPSWIRFDPTTRTFVAKAPAGSGSFVVRVFADDGQGGSGYADFTISYSGGVNEAPSVMTPDGIYTMDGRGDLNLATAQKTELFSVGQGKTATITSSHLKELDPDDDGADLTYTLTTLPRYGQLWLDADGNGSINGAEVALNIGDTFTQADIDAGQLKYRNTDTVTTTGNNPPDDQFIFNLADGGENNAAPVVGAVFSIQVTPSPTTPTLLSVLRATATTQVDTSYVTNDDTLTFKVIFSENVRGVGVADFALTGSLLGQGEITGVSVVNGSTYMVTVAGSGIANANGTLGLQLASTATITRSDDTSVGVSTTSPAASVNNELFTLDNTAPVGTLSGPDLHDGITAFWVTLDFDSTISDLGLSDLLATNATLSDLQRISTASGFDPDNAPSGDPYATATPEGNRYRVKVTPTATSDIVITLTANGVSDAAGNDNASASVTVVMNSAPTISLDSAGSNVNRSATFTELDGADNAANAVAFTTAGTSLADVNTGQNLDWLKVAIADAQIADGAAESLRIMDGGLLVKAIGLNFTDGQAIADFTLNSVSYSVTATVSAGTRSLSFAKTDGGTLTLAEAETLLDALRYNNSSDTPTAASRVFSVTANDGLVTSTATTFTVSVVAANDTPVISIGTGNSATASLTETNAKLTASGTLSVLDRDVSNTVAVSNVSVVASGLDRNNQASTTIAQAIANSDLLAMLSLDSGNVIDNAHTTGTLHWTFDSASQAFDYLAAGETLTLTYTVRASDSATTPSTDDQTVVITITGSNDAPKVTASSVSGLSNSTPTAVTASGSISFSELDSSDTVSTSFTKTTDTSYTATRADGSTAFTLDSAAITALQNALTVNAASGSATGWSYLLNTTTLKDNSATPLAIATGDKVVVSYNVHLSDGHGGNSTQALKFTLIGTASGGTLVVSGDAGSIVEGSPSTLSDAGSLTFNQYPFFASVSVAASPTITTSPALTLTSTQENAIKAGFLTSYAHNTDIDAVNWTYSLSESVLDFLPANQQITAVFTVNINDGAVTPALLATQNVTIVIQGSNDAPLITSSAIAAEGSVTEAITGTSDTAGGTLTANDVDTGATKSWGITGGTAGSGTYAKTGVFGSLSINSTTGAWTYTLDNSDTDTQALAAGQTAIETFTASVSDSTASATQLVRINVTGSNDAPVLAAPGTIATYTDTSGNDTFAAATTGSPTGTLSAPDTDTGDSRTYAVTGQTADTSRSGFTHSKLGSYGTLYLNALSGAYVYVPDAAKMNAATAAVNDDFTVMATDAAGANSNTATLSVALNGVNDAPTIILGSAGKDAAALFESNSGLTASGQWTVSDLDTAQTVTASVASGTVNLNNTGPIAMDSQDTRFGWLTLNPSPVLDASHSIGQLTWTFNSGSETFDALRAGETLTLVYTVAVTDGTSTPSHTVTVNITGTNDTPVISLVTGDAASTGFTENQASPLHAAGKLSVNDQEAGDTLTASVAGVSVNASSTAPSGAIPSPSTLLAMLSVSPTSTAQGATIRGDHGLTWTFDSGSEAFNGLAAGQTLVLDYTVRVVDDASGAPGMDTQTVTITITGANDAPVISYDATTSAKPAAGDDAIADAIQGFIASGFPDKLFDSGAITYSDLDVSNRPTASVTATNITAALRGGSAGSLSLSQAQQLAITSAFSVSPASGNTNTGTVNWNYTINQADVDFLGSGQTVTAVFTITVSDGAGGTDTQDVTINISGKNNAPVITVDTNDSKTASLTEANNGLTATDTLTVSDTNLTDAVTAVVLSGTVQRNNDAATGLSIGDARLGWLTLGSNPVLSGSNRSAASAPLTWTFNSGSEAFNDLAAGETLKFTYTIQVTDDAPSGSELSDTETVTITITGTNDAPVITAGPHTATLPETDAGLSSTGTLTVTDLDTVNTVQVSRTLAVSGNGTDAAAPSADQLLAMLSLSADNSAWTTGALDLISNTSTLYWKFDSSSEAFNYLAAGESLVLTYTVTATDSDGTPLSDTETVTITITGSNDAPIISNGPDAASLTETDNALSTSGTLTVADVDTTDVVSASRTLAVSGSSNRSDLAAPSDAQLLSMLTLTPTSVVSCSQTSANLAWAFDSGSFNFNYLADGETLVLTYTVIATDDNGTPLSGSSTVTLAITGSNDLPVITLGNNDTDRTTFTEGNTALTSSGTLTVSDADRADTVSPTVAAVVASGTTTGLPSDPAALLAMLRVNGSASVANTAVIDNTQIDGTLYWSFDSGSEHFDYLAAGEQLVLTYTVRVGDSGSTGTDQAVVVTITGSNDAPTVSIATPAAFVEAADASAQSLSASGNVGFVDLDASDLIDVSFEPLTSPVWSGGPLSAALVQSLAAGFSVAASNVAVTSTVNWAYSHAATDFDFLGAGETITFGYTVVVTDSTGAAVSTPVQFTLAGSNDGPTLSSVAAITVTDTAANDALAAVTGGMVSSDRDANDSATFSVTLGSTDDATDTSRTGYDRSLQGSYGTLYLNSGTGAYEYLPNGAAINALTANASESFTLTVTDGNNATANQVLGITLVAANDTPDLTASLPSTTYVDTAGDDNFVAVAGTLASTDRDAGATLNYTIQGGSSDASLTGYDVSKAGAFGTLYLNSGTGAYTFVPNDAAIEGQAGGTQAQDDFVFEVSDGSATSTTGFTAWIVGAGDPPIFSDGNDTAALTEGNATLTTSGNFTVTDNDLTDAVGLTTTLSVGGTSTATHPANADLLAMLSLSPVTLLNDASSTTGTVGWTFNSGTEHFDYLAAGETLVLTYTVTATDTGSPALSDSSTVTLTITGSNDGPALVAPATVALTDTPVDNTFGNVTGTLAGSDADHNAVLTYSVAGQASGSYTVSSASYDRSLQGSYGTLYLNSGSGAYVYVADAAAVEALKADASEAFSVRVSDGTASATQSLNVAIAASNDTPVLSASVTSIGYTDTTADDSFNAVTGNLSSVDRDGDAVIFTVSGQVSEVNLIDSVAYDAKRTGQYGTLYLNSTSGAYVFVPNDTAIEGLKTSTNESFSFVASDGSAVDAKLLTVSLTVANDTPALSASVTAITLTDTAANDSFASVSGALYGADRDANDSATFSVTLGSTGDATDTSRTGYDRSLQGSYGTLYLNSGTGAYEYLPNGAAINALTANASESFTLTVTDGSSATASQVLGITLVAANDTPDLTASLPSTTYVDTTATDTFGALTGTLTGADRDAVATQTYAIVGGATESNVVNTLNYDSKLAGSYGILYLNSSSGAYTFVPDETAINAQTANARDTFVFQVSDGTATSTTEFVAWIVGAGDAPVISEGSDTAALTEANAALSTGGTLTVTDNDLTDQVNLTASLVVGGTSTASHPAIADLLAMFTLNSTTVLDPVNTPIVVLNDGSSISTPVTWAFNSGAQHFDYLAAGETLVLTYTVSATDTGTPALSDTTTVTVTITGTNDGPALVAPATVALTDTSVDNTFANVTGTLAGSDADHNAVLTYSVAGQASGSYTVGSASYDRSLQGSYGTLYLNSGSGAYVYVADDAAVEALKADASEAFSVRVSDGTASVTQSLNVAIAASNDTPVLSASVTSIGYTDTAVTDTFHAVAGSLTSTDRDASETATYAITDGVADVTRAGFDLSKTGNYGTLFLHSATGSYVYVPNSVAINALTANASESFALTVTDATGGVGGVASQTLTVTITGSNDVPVVTNLAAATAGSVSEAGHADDGSAVAGTATASGTLSRSDVDAGATVTWSLQGTPSATYGSMVLDAATGVWTYTLDNTLAATQALREGEVVTQSYTARATDDQGAWVDQTLTVTITGSNDVPVVSSTPQDAAGTVVESGHLDDGSVFAGTPSVTQQIQASDVDASATRVYELDGTLSTRYGSIALNRDTGEWTYSLNNALTATQNLREGQSVDETYAVRVTDDRGAVVRETITVTIQGSNDVPVVVGALAYAEYLQGEALAMPTAQLFSDIDLNAGVFTYSAVLPDGLLIDPLTGVISGAATRPSDYDIVIRATDAQGAWVEAHWSVRINAPATPEGETGTGTSTPPPVIVDTGTGTSSTGTTGGTGTFEVLDPGIPGFSSTIPLPSSGSTLTDPGTTLGNDFGSIGETGDSGTTTSATTTLGGTETLDGGQALLGDTTGSNVVAPTATEPADSTLLDTPENTPAETDTRVEADGQLQQETQEEQAPSATEPDGVRAVERVDVSVAANGQIQLQQQSPAANEAPTGLMLVEVLAQNGTIVIEIADFRQSDGVTYRATLPDGSPLPDWIQIDARNGQITATPAPSLERISLRLEAQDGNGIRTLEININLKNNATTAALPEPARPAFMQQVQVFQQQWQGYGEQLLTHINA